QLTWFGVGFLMATALMMLLTIEKAFNAIWRVRQPRRGMSSFLLYWAILSLGPLLLGAAFAMSTYITSLSLISGPDALLGVGILLKAMPLILSIAAFTLIYAAVPNTRVSLRHALVGGVFTAVLFEAAKQLLGLYVRFFPSYQLIYGALEAHRHVGLRGEVVDLVGLHFLDDAGQVGGISEIAVLQDEILVLDVRVLIDVVHPLGVERRGATLDAMDLVTFFQQQFREIGTILAGNPGDQRSCPFHFTNSWSIKKMSGD